VEVLFAREAEDVLHTLVLEAFHDEARNGAAEGAGRGKHHRDPAPIS